MNHGFSIVDDEDAIVVAIHEDLNDTQARELRAAVSEAAAAGFVPGLIVDVSSVEIIDSYMARMLDDVSRLAAMYNIPSVLLGVQPQVALTLTQLGITFAEFVSVRTMHAARRILRSRASQNSTKTELTARNAARRSRQRLRRDHG